LKQDIGAMQQCISKAKTENGAKSETIFHSFLDTGTLFNFACDIYLNNPLSDDILSEIERTVCKRNNFFLVSGNSYLYPKQLQPISVETIRKTVRNDTSAVFRRKLEIHGQTDESINTIYTIYLGNNINGNDVAAGIIYPAEWGTSENEENRFYQFLGYLKRYYMDFSESPAISNFIGNKSAYRYVINASTYEILIIKPPADHSSIPEKELPDRQFIYSLLESKTETDTKFNNGKALDRRLKNLNISKCTIHNIDYIILSFNMVPQSGKNIEEHDQIIRNFSHKIRGKLSALRTAASQLNLQKGKSIDDDDITLTAIIQSSSDSLDRLVDRLNLYGCCSKPDFSTIDFNQLLKKTIYCRNEDLKSSQKIRFTPGLDINPVEGDLEQIQLAIDELINNAIDASRDGDTVSMSTQHRTGMVSLIIQNEISGPQKKISGERWIDFFEPFVSLESNKAGMGLNIARRIISIHGGKIKITTGPKNKISVTVDIPFTPKGKTVGQKG
jgi:hypothetical protein